MVFLKVCLNRKFSNFIEVYFWVILFILKVMEEYGWLEEIILLVCVNILKL